jgi:hypothetical protein
MKVLGRFPTGAVRNADFVTGRRKDGRVVDLQVDVETLPPVGVLVVHEDTVRNMVKKLGWEIQEGDALAKAEARVAELQAELEDIRKVMSDIAGYVNA